MGSQKIDGAGLSKAGAKVEDNGGTISPEEIKAAEKAKTNAEIREYYKEQVGTLHTILQVKYGDIPVAQAQKGELAELEAEYVKYGKELGELQKQFSEIPKENTKERKFIKQKMDEIVSKLEKLAASKERLELEIEASEAKTSPSLWGE